MNKEFTGYGVHRNLKVEDVRLIGDNILVEPLESANVRTKIGLILPKGKSGVARKGRVVAVGTGRITKVHAVELPCAVGPGDLVIYEKMLESEEKEVFEMVIGGKGYLLFQERNIMAVLREEQATASGL